MERRVQFEGTVPSWAAIRGRLEALGLPVQLRMIDGLPAFPEENPEEGWRELRISAPAGMATLRSEPGRLSVVVWGNATADLLRERDLIVEACSQAGNGKTID